MKRLKKQNRVSWATNANLCQVKLFLIEDCPSHIALEAQLHPRLKSTLALQLKGMDSNNNSEGYLNLLRGRIGVDPFEEKPCNIRQREWNCPPKFVLDPKWYVASGGESKEVENQKHREMVLLEAGYPHNMAIHPSASMALYWEDSDYDDSKTPVIPLIPIEEVKTPASDTAVPSHTAVSVLSDQPRENDIMVAAAAALAAFVKAKEPGSLIDMDLLIQFLNNPEMVTKLINEHGTPANTGSELVSVLNAVTSAPSHSSRPEGLTSIPIARSVSLPLPRAITISEHGAPADAGVGISIPKTLSHFISFPSPKPESEMMKFTDEQIPSPRVTTIPMSPSRPVPGATSLIKNLINEHKRHGHMESVHVAGLNPVPLPVQPLAFSPGSEPDDILKMKRLINEYGASGKTGNEPNFGTKLMTPLVPFPSPKTDDVFELPSTNLQPAANVLQQSTLHATPLSPDVHSPSFPGVTAPLVKDINYYKNLIEQHGETHERVNHRPHPSSPFVKLNNQSGRPELVKNINQSESMALKQQKPCLYFNSSRGCRNGSSCPFEHVILGRSTAATRVLGQQPPSAKRMKLGRGN